MKIIKKLFLMTMITTGLMPMVNVCAAESDDVQEEEKEEAERARDWKAVDDYLIVKVMGGDSARVNELLDSGADVNYVNEAGATPLYWAVTMNNRAMAQLLLDRGADARIDSETLLGMGANKVEMIKMLVFAGARYKIQPKLMPKDTLRFILALSAVSENLEQQDWDATDFPTELAVCIGSSDIQCLVGEYATPYYHDDLFSVWLDGDEKLHSLVKAYVGDKPVDQDFCEAIMHHHRVIRELAPTVAERQEARRARAAAIAAALPVATDQAVVAEVVATEADRAEGLDAHVAEMVEEDARAL